MRIRELTRDRRSLDDFARTFFAMRDGELGPLTYTYDDVVAALNGTAPQDWHAFLRERLGSAWPGRAVAGPGARRLAARLARHALGVHARARARANVRAATFSLGLVVARDGARIVEVVWGSPAFAAGLAPGATLVAVDGRAFDGEKLLEALRRAQRDGRPMRLLVRRDDRYSTVTVVARRAALSASRAHRGQARPPRGAAAAATLRSCRVGRAAGRAVPWRAMPCRGGRRVSGNVWRPNVTKA